ncbi:hypothetical protein SAMN04489812_4476 [Microlunatus soli]|uniref:Uncharacterized protein n=1 Tax=Microlunatus soli TaxID=630515 RepID=A0A1H1YA82_9ACTN|nr:hypothetical protein SAMN04489812_4476 [Microlunatus soli]
MYGTADHVADVLFKDPTLLPEGISDRGATTKGEWRAVAGWLMSQPALVLQILTAADRPDLFTDLEAPEPVEGPTPDIDDHEPAAQPPSRVANSIIPAALSQAERERLFTELARRIDPNRLAPRRVLHVHVCADALMNPDQHPARTEGLRPMVAASVRKWLDGSRVTVQPVIDPDNIQPVDSYETPPRIAEAIFTRSPGSVFPWSSSLGRNLDHDHTISYVPPPEGPPGQTGVHSLGLLNRPELRGKTFLIVRVRQPQPGVFVWRTDYGRVIITNPAGTHDLGTGSFPDTIWEAVKHCGLLANTQQS